MRLEIEKQSDNKEHCTERGWCHTPDHTVDAQQMQGNLQVVEKGTCGKVMARTAVREVPVFHSVDRCRSELVDCS